jgi:hypothetical protein
MGRLSCISASIRPYGKLRMLGTAITVRSPVGDNLMFHKALDLAEPGDVIVVDGQGDMNHALCGEKMMNFLVTASAIHAGRQTHEMEDCMTMLEDLGIDPIMTKATMLRMKWLAEKNLKEVFNGKVPEKWEDVITACAQ